MRVFLAVMDTASVTRAAEMVGLSAGAVSQQLRALGGKVHATADESVLRDEDFEAGR